MPALWEGDGAPALEPVSFLGNKRSSSNAASMPVCAKKLKNPDDKVRVKGSDASQSFKVMVKFVHKKAILRVWLLS